jgi:hypothetical protein
MHAATRRPAASWPAALLPGALLLALLTAGVTSTTGSATPLDASGGQPPVTELHVVDASR